MADQFLKLHKVTVTGGTGDASGTTTYYCLLNPKTYVNIGATVGITLASDTEQNNPKYKVDELIRAGVVQRMNVSGGTGTARRSFDILVTRDKFGAALDGIKGKVINGVTVGVGKIKRRATFY